MSGKLENKKKIDEKIQNMYNNVKWNLNLFTIFSITTETSYERENWKIFDNICKCVHIESDKIWEGKREIINWHRTACW